MLHGQSFDILHLGVGDGASLRMWREAFSEARLVGIDARRLDLDSPIKNCTLLQGHQSDPEILKPLLRKYRFRLIVDDESRHAEDRVQTFLTLFPWLEPDSTYICAGLDESWSASVPQEKQLGKAAGKSTKASRRVGKADASTGLAWFADLGRALTEREHQCAKTLDQTMRERALQKATGVLLLPGSVVVTS